LKIKKWLNDEACINSKKLLVTAIQENWAVSELEPLFYIHSEEECDQQLRLFRERTVGGMGNVSVGYAERVLSLMDTNGYVYINQILESDPQEIIEKCQGIGVKIVRDILWALKNFYRYNEAKGKLLKAMMPNPIPKTPNMTKFSLRKNELDATQLVCPT
jgi:hypothetical protein